jgi:hypothetical protein
LKEFGDFQALWWADLAKIGPVQQFHDEERLAVVLVDFENRTDVGMAQGRGSLGFTFEAAASCQVVRSVADELDRDLAAKVLVLSHIDGAHPTRTEVAQNAVVGNPGPFHSLGS